jgi:hypothetical protein
MSKFITKVARISIAAALAAGAVATVLAVAPPQAEADVVASGLADCPVHYACLWQDSNWSGTRWQGQFNNKTLKLSNGTSFNNRASSSFNNGTSCTAHFTTDVNYAGNVLSEGIGSIRQNLALDFQPNGVSWNDTIESLWWCSKS